MKSHELIILVDYSDVSIIVLVPKIVYMEDGHRACQVANLKDVSLIIHACTTRTHPAL